MFSFAGADRSTVQFHIFFCRFEMKWMETRKKIMGNWTCVMTFEQNVYAFNGLDSFYSPASLSSTRSRASQAFMVEQQRHHFGTLVRFILLRLLSNQRRLRVNGVALLRYDFLLVWEQHGRRQTQPEKNWWKKWHDPHNNEKVILEKKRSLCVVFHRRNESERERI